MLIEIQASPRLEHVTIVTFSESQGKKIVSGSWGENEDNDVTLKARELGIFERVQKLMAVNFEDIVAQTIVK